MPSDNGVALWRSGPGIGRWTNEHPEPEFGEPYVAFPKDEATAMDELEKVVVGLLDCEPFSDVFHDRLIVLRLAQASLDAARTSDAI